MRRHLLLSGLALLALLLASCSHDQPTAPNPSDLDQTTRESRAEEITTALFALTEWPVEEPEAMPTVDAIKCLGWIVDFQVTDLVDNIRHYRWDIRMSAEEMDVITLHRVVKVRRHRPIHTHLNLFLQHGDAKDFQGMFLPGTLSATTPEDFGAAVYWARRNVDVWGIDQAWNNVPAETADFAFMADWGLDKQYQDLGTGLRVARMVRRISGSGNGKMNLLGYSSGSATGYALLNAETQLPPGRRQVGGWISVDYAPLSDDAEFTAANCDLVATFQAMIDAGEYGYFVGFDFLGNLAVNDPDGMSPVFPGMTILAKSPYQSWMWERTGESDPSPPIV